MKANNTYVLVLPAAHLVYLFLDLAITVYKSYIHLNKRVPHIDTKIVSNEVNKSGDGYVPLQALLSRTESDMTGDHLHLCWTELSALT